MFSANADVEIQLRAKGVNTTGQFDNFLAFINPDKSIVIILAPTLPAPPNEHGNCSQYNIDAFDLVFTVTYMIHNSIYHDNFNLNILACFFILNPRSFYNKQHFGSFYEPIDPDFALLKKNFKT